MHDGRPQKVALLLPSLKFGGAERVALNLAMALAEAGINVDILVMSSEGEFLADAKRHFNVVDLRCDKTYKLPGRLLAYLARNRPDVLISSFWKVNLCACVARMLFPFFRLILWEHSPPSKNAANPIWLYAITASIFYQCSHKVVTVSTGVYDDISNLSIGLRRKLITIFNPITPPDPKFKDKSNCNGIPRQLIFVGRLESPKNIGLLIESFALIPEAKAARLVIVGEGSLRDSLEKLAGSLGIGRRVIFMGYQQNPYEIMAASDLLVVSSDREGLPSVIIEALYCGLRVVSTDCGAGVHDILLNGKYGRIVPPNDKLALVEAIEAELSSTHCSQTQKNGARRFLPQVAVQQFLAIMH